MEDITNITSIDAVVGLSSGPGGGESGFELVGGGFLELIGGGNLEMVE